MIYGWWRCLLFSLFLIAYPAGLAAIMWAIGRIPQ